MKTCSICRKPLPMDEFHRDRAAPDGRRSSCKSCTLAPIYRERQQNPARYRAYMREYMRETQGLRPTRTAP